MDKRDISSGVVLLFISILVLIASLRLGIGPSQSPGSGFMPFWSSLLLGLVACLLLGRCLIKKEVPGGGLGALWKGRNWGMTIMVVAMLIVYCLAMPKLGYLFATFGLMLVLFTLGKMNFWLVIPCSLFVVLFTYGLFDYLLKMPLPRGLLGF
jgi:putative tricarboxylic transport membrane protein